MEPKQRSYTLPKDFPTHTLERESGELLGTVVWIKKCPGRLDTPQPPL